MREDNRFERVSIELREGSVFESSVQKHMVGLHQNSSESISHQAKVNLNTCSKVETTKKKKEIDKTLPEKEGWRRQIETYL